MGSHQVITWSSTALATKSMLLRFRSVQGIGKREENKTARLRCYAHLTTSSSSEIHGDDPKQRLLFAPTSECSIQLPPHNLQVDGTDEIKKRELLDKIRQMLESINDGEISVSPYDTAWVALVESIDGSRKPQFPESLEWISRNQLEDGSWGDDHFFEPHDRLLNTLACVIALTSWNLHPHQSRKGISFIEEKIKTLGEGKEEHMGSGFELILPTLMKMAQKLGIHLPDDSKVVQDIYAKGSTKLSRIPEEVMHRKATTLLYSLEGISGWLRLDWNRLLKFQHENGSFLCSPASTAYALMQTNDCNCFTYLNTLVSKFNGGVPHTYPVDLFERLWVVDRLERLGISRFFESEITACINYVYGNWSEYGIGAVRNSNVPDIDDTCMGFKLLRMHGYRVSPEVLKHFKKDGEFFCYGGQTTEGVTEMFNLYRASQLQFPGETILEEARDFSSNYLRQKRASNQLFDKWVILKDLPGEVGYALDLPWYASLPRIESRFYIEHYGGEDDVWIGKTLYRMPYINNKMYLELAKLDFNAYQSIQLQDWQDLTRWYMDHNVGKFGLKRRELVRVYFVAAANIFEAERSNERLAWAKTWAMTNAIAMYFRRQSWDSYEERRIFVDQFLNSYNNSCDHHEGLVDMLVCTLNEISLDVLEPHTRLYQAWEKWMVRWVEEGDEYKGVAELITRAIHAVSGGHLEFSEFNLLLETANKICHQLGHLILQNEEGKGEVAIPCEVNSQMQLLLEMVLLHTDDHRIHIIKRCVLAVARGYYYYAYCSSDTIDSTLYKVLFQPVE